MNRTNSERTDIVEKEKRSLLTLRDRSEIEVDGVVDVVSFDGNSLRLKTVLGELTVDGEDLRVGELSLEGGRVSAKGRILGLYYTEAREKKSRFGRG